MVSFLELKFPPLAVGFACFFGMWLCPAVLVLSISGVARWTGFGVLFVLGFALLATGARLFIKARTSLSPTMPSAASSLVVTGIYRYTRNPMYLGGFVMLSAWAFFLSKLSACFFLPFFVAYLTRFQIIPEERILRAHFGVEYDDYVKRVRRWL
ncbi:MAG: isoprenylcysteine carboxylmethyltransferase family protein [Azoarcus sp.]|nr:isoprenylcysteine carboxylmethyltransferase family protein [Azoarcus sp.]